MYEQQISRGIALLDEKVPDWRYRINTSELNLSRFNQCVLGQVFGHYSKGLDSFTDTYLSEFSELSAQEARVKFSRDYGFESDVDHYGIITDEWLKALA